MPRIAVFCRKFQEKGAAERYHEGLCSRAEVFASRRRENGFLCGIANASAAKFSGLPHIAGSVPHFCLATGQDGRLSRHPLRR